MNNWTWPKGKTFGELTPDEKRLAAQQAGRQLQRELTANAAAIGAVLGDSRQRRAGRRTVNEEHTSYQLPARLLRPGMSTADGQDITDVEPAGDLVLYHTYTPRPDDEDEDDSNYSAPDGRVSSPDELIDLAVFPDTQVDGRITEKEQDS